MLQPRSEQRWAQDDGQSHLPGTGPPVQTGAGLEAPGESSQEVQNANTFNMFFTQSKGDLPKWKKSLGMK